MQRIHYGNDPRQVIEIHYPKSNQNATMIYYVHGGAWISSAINDFTNIAKGLTQRGFICVMGEYRLTDKTTKSIIHPMHCQDVIAGLEKAIENVQGWNGSVVLAGHSAGAFMTGYALTSGTLSPKTLDSIKGWIGIEGIYDIQILAEMYSTYIDWFLIHVFPNQHEWSLLSLYRPLLKQIPVTIIHSVQDELVDIKHAKEFVEYHKDFEFIETRGTHDGILDTVELLDTIRDTINQWG